MAQLLPSNLKDYDVLLAAQLGNISAADATTAQTIATTAATLLLQNRSALLSMPCTYVSSNSSLSPLLPTSGCSVTLANLSACPVCPLHEVMSATIGAFVCVCVYPGSLANSKSCQSVHPSVHQTPVALTHTEQRPRAQGCRCTHSIRAVQEGKTSFIKFTSGAYLMQDK